MFGSFKILLAALATALATVLVSGEDLRVFGDLTVTGSIFTEEGKIEALNSNIEARGSMSSTTIVVDGVVCEKETYFLCTSPDCSTTTDKRIILC